MSRRLLPRVQSSDAGLAPCAREPCAGGQVGARPRREGSLTQGILGVVLAGGRSSRFGSDKAAALLGGRPLADHARDLLAPHVERAMVAGRDGPVPDRPAPDLGPLGGIAGALSHAKGEGFESVLTIACDMPWLPDGLLKELAQETPAYCPGAPVLGHWPVSALTHLLAHIDSAPSRSVRGWADAIGARPVETPVPIANVNTPADLPAS